MVFKFKWLKESGGNFDRWRPLLEMFLGRGGFYIVKGTPLPYIFFLYMFKAPAFIVGYMCKACL
jgi:hypothetical protein